MIKQLCRKRWIFFAMALSLFFSLGCGVANLAINGKAHIQSMSTRSFQTFSDGSAGSMGSLYDRNGALLYSATQPAHRAFYSLVGSPQNVISNSVVTRYSDSLLGRDGYSLWQGAASLEGTGSDLFLTLDTETQKAMTTLLEEQGISGLVAACDASTGELLCLASTPAAGPEEEISSLPDGALLNKNLYTTTAGSTMKLVATALLVEQAGIEKLRAYGYTCHGADTLRADGTTVTCITRQGTQDIVSALGYSCNTFFASAIQDLLSVEDTTQALARYGFASQEEKKPLGLLTYQGSDVRFSDHTFSSVWSLIGQISEVSPLDMLAFTSALFHQGQAPAPYLVASQTNRTHTKLQVQTQPVKQSILSGETADQVASLWTEAYETYYDQSLYPPVVTAAKTGTAQVGNRQVNKLLMGYAAELDVAFFLSLENWDSSQISPQEVASLLLEKLAAADT